MVKADLGVKRVCPQCAARFYDLQKRPIECPKCEFSFEPESLYKQRRTRQPEPVAAVPIPADAEDDEEAEDENEEAEGEEEIVETVPDEAPVVMSDDDDEVVEEEPEPESAGMSVRDADEEDVVADIEVEDDEDEADDALLAEVEEDEDDVNDIIDADIKDDERSTRSFPEFGAIAQLGERLHGMQEVSGSIPLGSTRLRDAIAERRLPGVARRAKPGPDAARYAWQATP